VSTRSMTVEDVVAAWHSRGREFLANGVTSRVWSEGQGDAVLCLHGVPASSYLFRKLLPELAERGLRGVAIDFPGLGFAERPASFDYRWSGLAQWTLGALDALGLQRVHLLLHDIAVPIGFELARLAPERVLSATVLNSMIKVATFRRSWPMKPFAVPILGELWLGAMSKFSFEYLFRLQGVKAPVPKEEILAYLQLLRLNDRGRAFLKIMRSFELNQDFEDRVLAHLAERRYPAQVLWGEHDPALTIETKGEDVRKALNVSSIHRLDGKHYIPEEAPGEIAERVVAVQARSL
jgi:haloalkane dehalogenase